MGKNRFSVFLLRLRDTGQDVWVLSPPNVTEKHHDGKTGHLKRTKYNKKQDMQKCIEI